MQATPSRPTSHRLPPSWLMAAIAIMVFAGCQQGRLVSPLANRRAMDDSPPSMHGPSMHGPSMVNSDARPAMRHTANHQPPGQRSTQTPAQRTGQTANRQVRVTSENAVPETDIEPVEQRLATTRQVSHRAASASQSNPQPASNATPPQTNLRPNSAQQTATDAPFDDIAQVSASLSFTDADPPSRAVFELPEQVSGVDVSELMSALQDAPPEIQKAAVARLIAMARLRAKPTAQPRSIEAAVEAAFANLPELPTEVIDRGVSPTRIASNDPVTGPASSAVPTVATAPASASSPVHTAVHQSMSDQTAAPESTAVQKAILNENVDPTKAPPVSLATMTTPLLVTTPPTPTTTPPTPTKPSDASHDISSLTDAQLFDALLQRLQTSTPDESESDRHRRQVVARHLMVLAGDPDRAVDHIEGMSGEAEEYLRHQLLGLWTIIDPQGHPVPSRRFSSALPEIRKATGHLAAASDLLEVRGLEFCTEIEAYGQIKPFPSRRFTPGQEVILYCEIENFVTQSVKGGFETKLQGSYDLIDSTGRRISSQTLPEDHQVSKKLLRDYFIAYQMYLPDAIDPGRYQLRLTMEDVHGKKYGQATVDFEIKR